MVETEPNSALPPVTGPVPPWRGLLAFALLAVVGSLGPDITPSRYWPDLGHYVPRYVLLALSIGVAIGAVRSGHRVDRLVGLPVLLVGCGMVVYIVRACVLITGW